MTRAGILSPDGSRPQEKYKDPTTMDKEIHDQAKAISERILQLRDSL
ncbi:MAG: hypothetical protein BMS9Abin04_325 [Planctomycetia bacterium]|nr:MAG: hypothetical protein BMS9Abin04_325 [Planctomycetia bacterium]